MVQVRSRLLALTTETDHGREGVQRTLGQTVEPESACRDAVSRVRTEREDAVRVGPPDR